MAKRVNNTKIDITVNSNEFREVNRQRCIRKKDVRPLTEIVNGLTNTANDEEILRLAREIVYQGKRTERAIINESNLAIIKERLLENIKPGDMFTIYSAIKVCWNADTDQRGAHSSLAFLAVLDDLVKEGVLERKLMTHDTRCGTGHMTVYIVL